MAKTCILIILLFSLALSNISNENLDKLIQLQEKKLALLDELTSKLDNIKGETISELQLQYLIDNAIINAKLEDFNGVNKTEQFYFKSQIATRILPVVDFATQKFSKALITRAEGVHYLVKANGRRANVFLFMVNSNQITSYDLNGEKTFDYDAKIVPSAIKISKWKKKGNSTSTVISLFSKDFKSQEFNASAIRSNEPGLQDSKYLYNVIPAGIDNLQEFSIINSGAITTIDIVKKKTVIGLYADDKGSIHVVDKNHKHTGSYQLTELAIKKLIESSGKVFFTTERSFGRANSKGKIYFECFLPSEDIIDFAFHGTSLFILGSEHLFVYKLQSKGDTCADVRRYSLLAKGVERNTYSILRVVGDTLWVLSSKLNKSLLIFNLDQLEKREVAPVVGAFSLFNLAPSLNIEDISHTSSLLGIEVEQLTQSEVLVILSTALVSGTRTFVLSYVLDKSSSSTDWMSDLRLPLMALMVIGTLVFRKFMGKKKEE